MPSDGSIGQEQVEGVQGAQRDELHAARRSATRVSARARRAPGASWSWLGEVTVGGGVEPETGKHGAEAARPLAALLGDGAAGPSQA